MTRRASSKASATSSPARGWSLRRRSSTSPIWRRASTTSSVAGASAPVAGMCNSARMSSSSSAVAQLRRAPGIAGAPALAKALADHLLETEIHEQLVRERLEQLDASPSSVRDIVAAAGGQGFVLFARAQPDTPGKLAAHAYSYE